MRTYKKWMALLLAIMLLTQCISLPAWGADAEPKIVVGNAAALPGKTVKVGISLANNPGIVSMELRVSYDSEVLTLTGVEDAGILGSTMHMETMSNPYTLTWDNDTSETNFTVNGKIVTLVFTVKEDAALGTVTPVEVSYDPVKHDIFDKDLKDVSFAVENGSVTVARQINPIGDFTYEISGTELTITGYIGEDPSVIIGSEYTIDGVTYTVTAIGDGAFSGSTIESIEIPGTVKTIGVEAFLSCESLTEVVLSEGLQTIDDAAFYGCIELKEVEIPGTVETIGAEAFYNCENLKRVTVYSKTAEIGEAALGYYKPARKELLVEGFVLAGYADTTAQTYATDNEGITYEVLAEPVAIIVDSGARHETLAAAVENAAAGNTVKLLSNVTESVTVDKNLNLDLNGCSITGTVTVNEGCTLYGLDSQTDDFTVEDGKGYGKITQVSGTVLGLPEESAAAVDGYLKVTEGEENEVVSFHRVTLKLTAMSLRAKDCGIYYKSEFNGDEIVAKTVDSFGVALSLNGAPTEQTMGKTSAYSVFEGFQAGDKTSTLLKNILKSEYGDQGNYENANAEIYGRAYIYTEDGYMFGAAASRSLRTQLEKVDLIWSKLEDVQKQPVLEMYKNYTALMGEWKIPNIKNAASNS